MVKQNFNYEGLGITHTDSLLIVGELTEDVVSVGWADSHLRERRKFLTHLIQQSPHLQQKYLSQFWTLGITWTISPERTGSSSPLRSCAQSGAVGDTAPVWFDASPRTHRKPFLSHPAETAA